MPVDPRPALQNETNMSSNSRTRTRVLEEMNFQTGGGSMTVRIMEKERDLDGGKISRSHRIEFTHGSHGGYTTSSLPIGTGKVGHYIADALARTATRMDEWGSEGWTPYDKLKETDVLVVRGGLRARKVYRQETVLSHHETYAAFVGTDWLDEDGKVAFFEAHAPRDSHLIEPRLGWGGYSSISCYDDAEIGMTIAQVNRHRKDNGLMDLIPVKLQPRDYRTVRNGRGINNDGQECEVTPFTLPPCPTDAEIMLAIQWMFDHGNRINTQEMVQSIIHLGALDQERYDELRDKQQLIDQKG